MNQYPASWRIWRVEGMSRTNRPVVIRVKAADHNEAKRIASMRHFMRVTACVLIDEAERVQTPRRPRPNRRTARAVSADAD